MRRCATAVPTGGVAADPAEPGWVGGVTAAAARGGAPAPAPPPPPPCTTAVPLTWSAVASPPFPFAPPCPPVAAPPAPPAPPVPPVADPPAPPVAMPAPPGPAKPVAVADPALVVVVWLRAVVVVDWLPTAVLSPEVAVLRPALRTAAVWGATMAPPPPRSGVADCTMVVSDALPPADAAPVVTAADPSEVVSARPWLATTRSPAVSEAFAVAVPAPPLPPVPPAAPPAPPSAVPPTPPAPPAPPVAGPPAPPPLIATGPPTASAPPVAVASPPSPPAPPAPPVAAPPVPPAPPAPPTARPPAPPVPEPEPPLPPAPVAVAEPPLTVVAWVAVVLLVEELPVAVLPPERAVAAPVLATRATCGTTMGPAPAWRRSTPWSMPVCDELPIEDAAPVEMEAEPSEVVVAAPLLATRVLPASMLALARAEPLPPFPPAPVPAPPCPPVPAPPFPPVPPAPPVAGPPEPPASPGRPCAEDVPPSVVPSPPFPPVPPAPPVAVPPTPAAPGAPPEPSAPWPPMPSAMPPAPPMAVAVALPALIAESWARLEVLVDELPVAVLLPVLGPPEARVDDVGPLDLDLRVVDADVGGLGEVGGGLVAGGRCVTGGDRRRAGGVVGRLTGVVDDPGAEGGLVGRRPRSRAGCARGGAARGATGAARARPAGSARCADATRRRAPIAAESHGTAQGPDAGGDPVGPVGAGGAGVAVPGPGAPMAPGEAPAPTPGVAVAVPGVPLFKLDDRAPGSRPVDRGVLRVGARVVRGVAGGGVVPGVRQGDAGVEDAGLLPEHDEPPEGAPVAPGRDLVDRRGGLVADGLRLAGADHRGATRRVGRRPRVGGQPVGRQRALDQAGAVDGRVAGGRVVPGGGHGHARS